MTGIPAKMAPLAFGCSGTVLTRDEANFFAESQPFGFILFARNLENPRQIKMLTDDLRAAAGWNAPIMIDQEGGRVSRLGAPHWIETIPALDMADMPNAERLFWLRGRLIAADLIDAGIDVNCAPVADIARPETHAVLQNRCYGTTPEQVVRNAKAMVAGQDHGGVASVLKHIPGHGLGTLDSHLELPRVAAKRADLDRLDFEVFKQLNTIDMGMSAHLVFEDIDPDYPATQSETMINVIRDDIGFDGLLMSDDISMNALQGQVDERATAAWAAGCDLVLHCNGELDEMKALMACAPDMGDAASIRAQKALKSRPKAQSVDIFALRSEFAALMAECA